MVMIGNGSKKSALDRLASEIGENPMVTGMFCQRMATKIGVDVDLVVERLTRLVLELKAERGR